MRKISQTLRIFDTTCLHLRCLLNVSRKGSRAEATLAYKTSRIFIRAYIVAFCTREAYTKDEVSPTDLQTQYDITEEAAWHSSVLNDHEVQAIGKDPKNGASTKPKKHFSEI